MAKKHLPEQGLNDEKKSAMHLGRDVHARQRKLHVEMNLECWGAARKPLWLEHNKREGQWQEVRSEK